MIYIYLCSDCGAEVPNHHGLKKMLCTQDTEITTADPLQKCTQPSTQPNTTLTTPPTVHHTTSSLTQKRGQMRSALCSWACSSITAPASPALVQKFKDDSLGVIESWKCSPPGRDWPANSEHVAWICWVCSGGKANWG